MVANFITLARLVLVFVVVALFGRIFYLDLLMIGATALILALDAVDGYVARKRKETSDFGALFDIAGDRFLHRNKITRITLQKCVPEIPHSRPASIPKPLMPVCQ